MNDLLIKLYASKWDEISDALLSFNEEDPGDRDNLATHPLLLKTNKEYETAKCKIMFFGQETNWWGDAFNYDSSTESTLEIYERFYLNKGYEQYGKPFWNFIKKIKQQTSDNGCEYIYNNVLKIGKCESGTPQQGLLNYTAKYFNVIPQEIEILKPDIILFFSGVNYDNYINDRIAPFSISPIEGFGTNELCKINLKNTSVKLALRTYHPSYLQRLGKDKFHKIFDRIMQEIKNIN